MQLRLKTFKFDLQHAGQARDYEALKNWQRERGVRNLQVAGQTLQQPLPELLELDDDHLFDNQFNTKPVADSQLGLRLFDFVVYRYPNANLRDGHYLENIEELRALRAERYVCRFCGYQQHGHDAPMTCPKCRTSEHLSESNLPLRVLRALWNDTRPAYESDAMAEVRRWLEDDFVATRQQLRNQKIEQLKQDYAQELRDLEFKLKAECFLLSRGFDTDNFIIYNGPRGSFGWRKLLDAEQAEALKNRLLAVETDMRNHLPKLAERLEIKGFGKVFTSRTEKADVSGD